MEKILITIARQYGSGGRAIGERLGKLLDIPCYDRELIQLSAKKSGIEEGILALHDERTSSASTFKVKGYQGSSHGTPIVDTLFLAQSQVIQELAQKGSCIFIGRCADYVLQDEKELFSLFISAPEQHRIARIMERNHMSASDAEMAVRKVDKQRRTYYDFYTDKAWGLAESYRLAVDSSLFGVEKTADFLKLVISSYMEEKSGSYL